MFQIATDYNNETGKTINKSESDKDKQLRQSEGESSVQHKLPSLQISRDNKYWPWWALTRCSSKRAELLALSCRWQSHKAIRLTARHAAEEDTYGQ